MIIDFHTHIAPPEVIERRAQLVHEDHCLGSRYADPSPSMATAEDLISSMDQDGIDVSVIANMGWSSIELCRETGPEQSPPFEIDPYDPEGFDVIMRNGSQANYMRDDHTLKNTGNCFLE